MRKISVEKMIYVFEKILICRFLRYFWRFYNGAGNSAENCAQKIAQKKSAQEILIGNRAENNIKTPYK